MNTNSATQNLLQKLHPSIFYPYTIVLSNGEFPTTECITDLFYKAHKIICCDGALLHLDNKNITPNYIIGDCDSITNELYEKYKTLIIKDNDQNSNDLTKAIRLAHQMNLNNIIILGATGLREDHTLANISLLASYGRLIDKIAIISDYGIFTTHKSLEKIHTIIGQQISIFAPHSQTIVSAKELKWPLNNLTLNSWETGTLNEATSYELNIETIENKSIILYRSFCIK